MTDSTDPTFTADELDEEAEHTDLPRPYEMLRFAARRERQTCETCKFAGKLLFDPAEFVYMTEDSNGRECHLTKQLPGGSTRMENKVPLTIHGRPFGCAAHEPTPVGTHHD